MAPESGESYLATLMYLACGHRTAMLVLSVALLPACKPADKPPQRSAAWVDPSPHRVQFVEVEPGVSLEVLDWAGSGPVLVFLSGLQDVAHGFDDFAPRFTDRHRVIGITRRGYGASSQVSGGYDVATRVADVRAVLDSLHLGRVILVGHSIAGDELTGFAAAYPERVSSLRELRGAEIIALHGANHYVFDSNAAEVAAAMRAFLASISG